MSENKNGLLQRCLQEMTVDVSNGASTEVFHLLFDVISQKYAVVMVIYTINHEAKMDAETAQYYHDLVKDELTSPYLEWHNSADSAITQFIQWGSEPMYAADAEHYHEDEVSVRFFMVSAEQTQMYISFYNHSQQPSQSHLDDFELMYGQSLPICMPSINSGVKKFAGGHLRSKATLGQAIQQLLGELNFKTMLIVHYMGSRELLAAVIGTHFPNVTYLSDDGVMRKTMFETLQRLSRQ